MNLSNHNPSEKAGCNFPILPVGQNFLIDFGRQESIYGTWQIVSNEHAPFYMCRRVYKNGEVSRRKSADHRRQFFEAEIYYALNKA